MDLIYKKINQGSTATIYRKNDVILKQYYYFAEPRYLIKEDLFYTLKEINHPNLMKLYRLLKNNDIIEGYICQFIKSTDTKIVERSLSYTLDNLHDLSKLIEIFNQLSILINDATAYNIIMQENKMVIIDPNSYKIDYSLSYERISINNKKQLLEYIKSLYLSCYTGYAFDYYRKINNLFNFKIKSDTNLCDELSKRLVCKKPIDVLKKAN